MIIYLKEVRIKYIYINSDGVEYDGEVKKTDDFTAEGEQIWLGENHEVLTQQELKRNVDGEDRVVYEYIDGDLKGEEYVGDVWLSEHGRRMGDTEMLPRCIVQSAPVIVVDCTVNRVFCLKQTATQYSH